MSKRRRKNNSRKSTHPVDRDVTSDTSRESESHSVPNKPKKQLGLLALAVLLLALVLALNVRRVFQDRLPAAVPLPVEAVTGTPLAKPSRSTDGATRFTALSPTRTGVDFTHPVIADHPMAYLYFSSTASGGTAVGDVNGDGRPDLFVASGPKENRLYIQTEEDFTFVDVTSEAGVGGGDAWSCGATMVDINGDGRLDIYVANYDSPNDLFVNLGNGKFKNMAWEYGLNLTNASLEGTFADYDRDGFLDMYLLNYRYENPAGMPETAPVRVVGGERRIQKEFEKYYEVTNDSIGYGTVGRSDGLLRNNGDGTFSDVTSAAGLHGAGHGQSATWWDFNDDGFADLHVGNDFNDADHLYRNNGDGTFTDVIRESVPHITWFSMGADAGDINGDQLPDLLSSDMSSTTHFKQKTTMGSMGNNIEFLSKAIPRQYMRNALLLNSGTERFKEAAYLTGLDSTDWTWSVKMLDLDCDGMLDVFFTNGSARSFTDSDRVLKLSERKGKTEWDLYKDTEPLKEKNLVFRNQGDLNFQNVSAEWGLDHLGVSMSSAHADFDGDGDLDLVVAHLDEPLTIYRNDSTENNRVTFRLHGRDGNRYGIGAKVRVQADGKWLVRELQPSRGFLSSNEPLAHFGVGAAEQVDVVIRWPNGGIQSHRALKVGQHYDITEQPDLPTGSTERASPLYETIDVPGELVHQENDFDDYQLQPLLPHRMSQLGPSIATADVDADGDIDIFLGGSAGQPGRLAIREGDVFVVSSQPALESDKAAEDMGAVWLDADNDGDEDLFVASGGNEFSQGADEYRLRLYLNDQGVLQRSVDRMPDIRVSAGPVSAADFDGDGDVDLFIGGRQVPGKYPLPAKSYLLQNDGGVFSDATKELTGGLEVGMVTGSLWSDVDNDADLDLLLATEWGSMHLFRNDGGVKLVDESAQAGLTSYRGWWTGITSVDLDGDGDLDYVATNMGLNTKYHASDTHPFRLFYGDFEGNGERKLVEAEYENDTLFPVRGKSCSTHAMPSLANKFTTYKSFATASLQEIYTPQCLDEAYECSANWLRSVALLNDGTGSFKIEPLPNEAQLSPGFGSAIADITLDGIPDVFIAQNFFSPQPETGNMDGGLGCLLVGQGDGRFEVIETRDSGIVIPQDSRSCVILEIDNDGLPDFLVSTNDSKMRVAASRSTQKNRTASTVQLRFVDAGSTSRIAGARVTVRYEKYPQQTFELAAGSGYLSQQSPVLFFSRPQDLNGQIEIVWSDGKQTKHEVNSGVSTVDVKVPR